MTALAVLLSILSAAIMLSACSGHGQTGETETENPTVSADIDNMDFEFTDGDKDSGYDEASATVITLSDGESKASGSGAEIDRNGVTLSSAGTYIISGKLSDGRILVKAGKKDKLRIVLRNADVTCGDGAALVVESADKVFLTLDADSENVFCDGSTRADDSTSVNGAIFSRSDLTVNGSGSLSVVGSYKHGIVSKDDLVITGGVISVKAQKVGLCGKDCVKISDGSITVNAGSDAIRSDNTENSACGYVYICGGTLDLTAGNDGIQAVTLLEVAGGEIKAVCGGGSNGGTDIGGNASDGENGAPEIPNGEDPNAGGTPPDLPDGMQPIDGDTPPDLPDGMNPNDGNSALEPPDGFSQGNDPFGKHDGNDPFGNDGGRPGGFFGGGFGDQAGKNDNSEESCKGLKSDSVLNIVGGNIDIDSKDDAIHSDGEVSVTGGTITVSSGDDGIHADVSLSISGGEIVIEKSYEGLESAAIAISGGKISVTSSDDGINASDGSGNSMMGVAQNVSLVISGGYITVNAGGDGIDSNGGIIVTGGVTLVSGPTTGADGAIDYETEAKVTGGVLIAAGSSGMAEGFTSADGQGAMLVNIATQTAGTSLVLCDSDGKAVVSFTPQKQYSSVVFTAPEIVSGKTYTVTVGAEINGADENGYALNPEFTGGSTVATVEMTSNIYGSSGGSGFRPGRR